MPFGTTKFELRLPASTEEWAEDLIEGKGDELELGTCERTNEALIVRYEMGGNLDAITAVRSWFADLEEVMTEGQLDPHELSLTVTWEPKDA